MAPRSGKAEHEGSQGSESEYVADFMPVEKRFYPYQDSASILDEWPEHTPMTGA
jgi:hypothetical protein